MLWILFALVLVCVWAFFSWQNSNFKHPAFNALAGAIFAVVTFGTSLTIVESGEIDTLLAFGIATNQDLEEGVYLIAPWKTSVTYSSRRDFIERSDSSGNPLITLSKDPTEIQVDYVQPYQLKAGNLGELYQKIGGPNWFKESVMDKASKSSVRDTSPAYKWQEAAATKKLEFAQAIQASFEDKVNTTLLKSGLTKDKIESMVVFHPVDLRRARPTSPKIVNAVAEKLAEVEELEKEKTVTKKAEEIARRRTNEGQGLANLFTSLPKGFKPAEISSLLHAMADKTRADAILKSVSQGNGDITLMAVPSTTAISVAK